MSLAIPSTARQPARPSGLSLRAADWLADALLLLSVGLLFTVSANALFAAGSSYSQTGGNPLTKFHPGTLTSLLALSARIALVGPRRSIETMLGRAPAATVGGVLSAFAILYIVAILRLPVTPSVETFLMAFVLFGAFTLRGPVPAGLPVFLHGFFALNACLGLVEFASGWRLTPFVAGTVVLTTDWRSTALLGHPLANALITATYVSTLVFSPPAGLGARWRPVAIGLQMAALVAFGGRTGIVVASAVVGGAALLAAARFLAGARVRIGAAALAIGVGVILVAAATALAQSGFFDRLLERFANDSGSAKTRVVMFRIFEAISAEALWLGPDSDLVKGIVQREGLEYGIESFPVALLLNYGVTVAALLIGGMAAMLRDLVRLTRPASVGVIAVFILISLASLSLAAKTVLLAQLCAMLFAFYGRTVAVAARA